VIVVADTSPLRYLILIEHIHVLPALYGRVVVPPAVVTELDQERTPGLVRLWLAARPEWLQIQAPQQDLSSLRDVLGPGEQEAIALAEELSADALLIDDRDGRREAEKRNLAVLGTLRVLADAAEHGFADLRLALDRLRLTNFRADEPLIQRLLALEAKRRGT
jgi:predicted nucleic acid-binding protein